MRRLAVAAVPVVMLGQCAPQCAPAPPTAPSTTSVPGPTPPVATVSYDGAGPTAPWIGLIGDSTMASIRWTDAYAPLRQWNYTYDAESCRRTITASCHGPDGYAPANALDEMHRLSGQLGVVLVMMLGANDPLNRFGEGIDAVVAEARAQGIATVIWLTVPGADDKNAVLAQAQQTAGTSSWPTGRATARRTRSGPTPTGCTSVAPGPLCSRSSSPTTSPRSWGKHHPVRDPSGRDSYLGGIRLGIRDESRPIGAEHPGQSLQTSRWIHW